MKYFFSIFFIFSFIFITFFGINCFYNYIFPIKYSDIVHSASVNYGIDENVIYSIINIESHFNKNAKSAKGAVGLMQILPTTAQDISSNFDLYEPSDNINIGTYYLSSLLSRFDNMETAICAYNAGPTNVTKWLNNEKLYSKI